MADEVEVALVVTSARSRTAGARRNATGVDGVMPIAGTAERTTRRMDYTITDGGIGVVDRAGRPGSAHVAARLGGAAPAGGGAARLRRTPRARQSCTTLP